MLTSERIPLHNSITCTSECAVYKVFFVCSWSVVGLLLFLLCHLHAVSLLSALVSFSSVSPSEKKSILYVSCGIRLFPTSYTPSGAPSKGGGWWLLSSLTGQLFFISLVYYTFLKRPFGIYSTIKSVFLWCNLSLSCLFCVWASAECFINFLL